MGASTLEELADDLDDELQWRRTELHAIKSEISKASISSSSPLGRAMLRSGVTLLYAHWEGYSKEALQAYLDFVVVRKLKYGELNDALATTAIMSLLTSASRGDPTSLQKVLRLVRDGPNIRARLPRDGVVSTKSNLRHEVLTDILSLLGLEGGHFETKAALIDRSLCDQRNAIAHGRVNFPTKDEYVALHVEVLALIEAVRDLVLNAAGGKKYRSDPAAALAPSS